MSRPFVAISLLVVALAAACGGPAPPPAQPTYRDVDVGEDAAIQDWLANLTDGWRAVLAAVQATSAAYAYVVDTPTTTLQSPEGLKEAGKRIELAQDAVRRLESFGVQPPRGIAFGYREYFFVSGSFVPGRRYYNKLLSEADLSKSGFDVIVRFGESLCFSNMANISDSLELYATRDGAVEFFSTRRRLVARTTGFLGGRRSFLAAVEFFDPFRKIATPAKKSSVEELIFELKH